MIFIPPDRLGDVWPGVMLGVRKVKSKCREPWNEHDVHRCLLSGQAQLFVRDGGFLILQRRAEDWSMRPYLFVWIAWFPPGKARPIRHELIAFLDALCKQAQCQWIEFASPLKGWMGVNDFKRVRQTFRREI